MIKFSKNKNLINLLFGFTEYITNLFGKLKDSAVKSWRGEEKLWKVFLGWGILLYVVSIFVGLQTIAFYNNFRNYEFIFFLKPFFLLISILGFILIFIYPIIFTVSILKCSLKSKLIIKVLVAVLLILFSIFHISFSIFTIVGSTALFLFSLPI